MRVEGEKNKAPLGKRTGIHELRLIELFTHYTDLLVPVPVCVCEGGGALGGGKKESECVS